MPYAGFSMEGILPIISFGDTPIKFKSGDYKFWFKFVFMDGTVFLDSVEVNYTTKEDVFDVMLPKNSAVI